MTRLSRRAGDPPLYAQLAEVLTSQISAGEFKVGSLLPPEHSLANAYGLSRATVVKALDTLADRGLVVKQQGKGTFVTSTPLDRPLNGLGGFTDHVTSLGMKPGQQLLSRGEVAATEDPLHEPYRPDSRLYELVRRRLVGNTPVGTQHSVLPYEVADAIGLDDDGVLEPSFSLYARLERSPYAPRRARETLRAINCSEEDALTLEVDPGTALIEAMRESTDGSGRVVEVVRARYLGSWYVYRVELS
ncbi:GntR family transcriptional regulator [Nocardioides sp. LMS-CY]|uniref:GntR family transcriptional regulator n=1 Tax=Nocardioides sp. (strain LMS-CY) TaxID=2840457 RepID=UPI001C006AED|nr:GntR family transcriptional regulator [Nocardioides sp. LMS-CY]QWF20202.1 GntR family transcriptional regulator [Nocardioides sp. LMS-CY]